MLRVCFNLEEWFGLDLGLPREFIMGIILRLKRYRWDYPKVQGSDWRTRTYVPESED